MAWYPHAKNVAAKLAAKTEYEITHQFTFATSSLPPILPNNSGRRVWGPLAIPDGAVVPWGKQRATLRESTFVRIAAEIGRRTLKYSDTVICQNDTTFEYAKKLGLDAVLEPNVVAEPVACNRSELNNLIYVGNLIDRKRPWLAIQALNEQSMGRYTLDIVGDGPLFSALKSYVRLERLDNRVRFHGRLTHSETIQHISDARTLLLPSSREGAGWVVGEAAACGVPSVVFSDTGAATVQRLSGHMGSIVRNDPSPLPGDFARGIRQADTVDTSATDRWSSVRLAPFLDSTWFGRGVSEEKMLP
ncbi:glycosyltransferase [Rhodococcus cercidiphylli]|uniref:glycosyltransferase n=1 Tax=Rhodococcus cercidiphylli TaxID=489916 RepID=UPI00374ECF88